MDNPASLPIVGYSGTASTDVQQYWLDVAWRSLQGELSALVDNISAGSPTPEAVADVVTAAARRVLRNPDGLKSESGSLDDFTESRTRADDTEDVYFTAAELRRLTPAAAGDTGFSGSIKYAL